ncbi:hypothetical protein NIES4071_106150 (plasmid) [Calothrix sp. NIES-4071]|nr:hypothetical protein NIES4071_106150 [Calothrix sp. NIES-4071]BAZ65033.1 hypothetical protein NIES4105_107660 [Calothrix sp. NIES-4105]
MTRLLLPGRHLLYSTELAAVIGRNEAICLQQIHYWMGVQGGKAVDGVKWFWKTYEQWSIELNLSVSTVRRVIANLKNLNLIRVDRLSATTYYQANWYTLNHEALEALIKNEHIEAPTVNTSRCSEKADDNKESSSKEVTLQQHPAAELQKLVQEEENNQEVKEPLDSYKVTESNQDAANEQNLHEGNNSGAPGHDKTTDDIEKMTTEELRNVTIELREMPCTPAFKINPQVLATIKKHPHNVPGAIAYLKEALRSWTRVDCPEAVFSKACKEGLKPANWGKPVVEHPQPSDEQMAELKRSLSKREIRDLSKAPSGLWFVDTGTSILSWWDYLQVQV